MQVKAETGKGKKKKKRNNRLAFILRRQWVGKWIPAKLRAGLSHWAGNTQSNELPGVWKCLQPGSAPTSGPLPFPATLSGAARYKGLPVGREKSPSLHPWGHSLVGPLSSVNNTSQGTFPPCWHQLCGGEAVPEKTRRGLAGFRGEGTRLSGGHGWPRTTAPSTAGPVAAWYSGRETFLPFLVGFRCGTASRPRACGKRLAEHQRVSALSLLRLLQNEGQVAGREKGKLREIMKSSMERGKGKRRNNANKNAPFWSDEGSLKIFYTLLATLKLPLNNSQSLQITVSQTEKDKYHKTSLICVIWKTGTNELV